MSYKILICDDHPTIRRGVKLILQDELPISEFGEASNETELVKLLQDKPWDMLILDVELPGANGLEVLHRFRARGIRMPVLVFSMYPDEAIAAEAFRSGASGFLPKHSADKELVLASGIILKGGKFMSSAINRQWDNMAETSPVSGFGIWNRPVNRTAA